MRPVRILVVDDDRAIRHTLLACLEAEGHLVTLAATASEALESASMEMYDLVLLDLRLGTQSGLDLIPRLVASNPRSRIIVITAHASIETAVDAIRRGAADYLPKPFEPDQVRLAISRAVEVLDLERNVSTLRADLASTRPPAPGSSANSAMQAMLQTARTVAVTDASVLITGESGSGKGLVGRAIHDWSRRREAPFVVVHTPSLSAELLESELFGHTRGAFTGAVNTNVGRVAQAEGGTLFLDEIGDLPPALQPKLLRFIQDREFERLGDPTTRRADVRIIAATNVDLSDRVASGAFREDLYYRLNVIELRVPPLRNRPEDIVPLAEELVARFARKYNRAAPTIPRATAEALRTHEWPGNVRELQNTIERVMILSQSSEITPQELGFAGAVGGASQPMVGDLVSLADIEEAHIRRVVAATETLEEAARVLEIDPTTLYRRRRQYGI